MATQFSQSVAIPYYTLLANFRQIGPVVFPKICLQAKNTLSTNWTTVGWQLGNNYMDEIHQGQSGKEKGGA